MLVSLGQFSVGGFSLGASKARAVGWGHNTKNVHETCTVAFCHVLWHNVRMRTACTRRLPSNTAGLGRAAPQRRLRSIHCHLPRPDEDQEPMVTMQGRDKLANQAGDNGAPSALKPMLFATLAALPATKIAVCRLQCRNPKTGIYCTFWTLLLFIYDRGTCTAPKTSLRCVGAYYYVFICFYFHV